MGEYRKQTCIRVRIYGRKKNCKKKKEIFFGKRFGDTRLVGILGRLISVTEISRW